MDERIGLAVDWLVQNQRTDTTGGAGWGWVPDVPPNPQDTAEVVCALIGIGGEVPNKAEVVRLLQRDSVLGDPRGARVFRAPIDMAWRLRALLALGFGPADRHVTGCVAELLAEQDPVTGGWRMSSRTGAVSVTATTEALRALVGVAPANNPADPITESVTRGIRFVVSALLDDDVQFRPLFASAQAAIVLLLPEIASFGGKRLERARELALAHVLETLRDGGARVEEETVRRGDVADSWRHVSLHWAVTALACAGGGTIFDPAFRGALKDLLDLQDTEPALSTRGGFRTSREGFVTTYATVQALAAMGGIRVTLNERVNPAKVFDLICRDEGTSPDDPQELLAIRGRSMVMNSYAGAAVLAIGAPSGATIAILAVAFANRLGDIGSRALVVWGTLFIALGTYLYVTTRFPAIPKVRTGALVFAGFTAVILPVLTFLLS
ncbi:hypothetical protein ABZ319_11860 [Nocardia sp. NPDC005978]|uniref:hypothetical protein n=1 Tax=Nocardia sp. NPDC005978 TaxID=3156725 RepID=UPI0033AA7CAB